MSWHAMEVETVLHQLEADPKRGLSDAAAGQQADKPPEKQPEKQPEKLPEKQPEKLPEKGQDTPIVAPEAKTVVIGVSSTPPGAEIYVGDEKTPRGTTPMDLSLPKTDKETQLTLRLSGYKDKTKAAKGGKEDEKEILAPLRSKREQLLKVVEAERKK